MSAEFRKCVLDYYQRTRRFVTHKPTCCTPDSSLIHKDCRRALQICTYRFQLSGDAIGLRRMQAVFELYFVSTIAASTVPLKSYYQGLTDIFEVIFTAFVNFEAVTADQTIEVEESDYKTPTSCGTWYVVDFYKLVAQSALILKDMYFQSDGFSDDYVTSKYARLERLFSEKDRAFFNAIMSNPQAKMLLYGPVISTGLHYTQIYSVAEIIAKRLITRSERENLEFLQQLISVSARLYCTLLDCDYTSCYHAICAKYIVQYRATKRDALECASYCLSFVLNDTKYLTLVGSLPIRRFTFSVGIYGAIGLGLAAFLLSITILQLK